MKRSRRSLGILLATMSLALIVVRATTLPARPFASSSNNCLQPLASFHSCVSLRESTSFREAKGDKVVPCIIPPHCAVSSTAVIFVLPRAAIAPEARPRFGWSGCSAYANGCDHLGRALALETRRRPGLAERLIIARLQQVFMSLTRASLQTTAVLLEIAAPLDQRDALASDWPELLREP